MAPGPEFPPVRACIFDLDGLLIDSEDAYTRVTNTILRENGRPDLPWALKARLQGRPGPEAGKIFHAWAHLPLTEDEFLQRQTELQKIEFTKCKPLPGVESLLRRLSQARTMRPDFGTSPSEGGYKIHLALATSSKRSNFGIKTDSMRDMFSVFPESQIVVGDDPRVPRGRGKPLPDIYLLSLRLINQARETDGSGDPEIQPDECLVFEDSVPGVEAGRRAGMRVIWCPHPGLREVYHGREREVLAGLTGEHDDNDVDHAGPGPLPGSPGHVGQVDDGWAERLDTLEDFDYVKYAIDISDARYRTESGQSACDGTTDQELEAMTAAADGKFNAMEAGTGSEALVPQVGVTL